jgi:hypothetical protein
VPADDFETRRDVTSVGPPPSGSSSWGGVSSVSSHTFSRTNSGVRPGRRRPERGPVFAVVQGRSSTHSASLDPDDPESPNFDQGGEQSAQGEKDRWDTPRDAYSPETQPS